MSRKCKFQAQIQKTKETERENNDKKDYTD